MSDTNDGEMPKAEAKKINVMSLNKEVNEQALKLTNIEKEVSTLQTSMADGFADMMKAINRPVSSPSRGLESSDVYAGDDNRSVNFRDNNGEVELERSSLTSVNEPEFKKKVEQMKFDNEKVEIMVHSSSAQYADNTFTVGVNGRLILIVRGVRQWVPRNYVEVMARSKTSQYGNFEQINTRGEREVKNPETKSNRFPLQIITDRNPLGPRWFERVMNDRA